MKIVYVLLIMSFLILSGCKENTLSPEDNLAPAAECTIDSDCVNAGCSGELCLPADKAPEILTACSFLPEYTCLSLTTCSCTDGSCGWVNNEEYSNCLEEKKKQEPIIIT